MSAFLNGLHPSAMRLGLDRVHEALETLGRPEQAYPIVHIAGTNGKGSTCAFIAAALRAQGHRVGLYTSPHLLRVNERFRLNGEPVSDDQLDGAVEALRERLLALRTDPPSLTFFEVGTLAAFWLFAQEKVDIAVVETGLGGRLDATNVARSTVTGITSIGLDHTDILGRSLAAIAREKAGIFKPGVPAISARQSRDALQSLESSARALGVTLRVEGRDFDLEPDSEGGFTYRSSATPSSRWRSIAGLRIGLKGKHQRSNAAGACACLEALAEQGLGVSPEALRSGLHGVKWEGRLEEVDSEPPVILDGAHNPAAAGALSEAMAALYPNRPYRLVFGILADKDRVPMMRALFPGAAAVYLARPSGERGLDPSLYLTEARELCPEVEVHRSVEKALEAAVRHGKEPVLVTGSLTVIGEAKAVLPRVLSSRNR